MPHYIFTINLATEDLIPSYQITKVDVNSRFRLVPRKMPLILKNKDTLEFEFHGRGFKEENSVLVESFMYIRPVDHFSKRIPFRIIEAVGRTKRIDEWVIVLKDKKRKKINKLEVVVPKGSYEVCDFAIAGVFKATLHNNNKKKTYTYMPFLVDPEVVVGGDDN